MDTASLLLIGAAGGAARGIVHAYDCMSEWLVRRREFRLSEQPATEGPPAFGTFYDIAGESIAAVVHTVLGAGVAMLMASWGQVSGGFATFAVGASAPLILVQLKHSRLAEIVIGDSNAPQSTQPHGLQPPTIGPPNEQTGPRRPDPGGTE
ncbi:hypothetical protein [Streptomyces formicae]|uniref:Uncharacterized protein n=1 Tax=Streptomyces formicae TaxID=1616117 RepID=A0A291Q7E2_9ACTN|nr:hypothetical protein [Streptomyces formicae]ATL27641.1 hypothetical protein KY5_2623 [Streptomyces formicae]